MSVLTDVLDHTLMQMSLFFENVYSVIMLSPSHEYAIHSSAKYKERHLNNVLL